MAILADLFGRLGVGPENVATEALNLILKGSERTRKAFIRFCAQSGVDLPENLSFQTQVRSEEFGQPDLVGTGDKGDILIVEAKFDAGFTENQPVSYFAKFAVAGLLLFVVPEYRQQTAWVQLRERCRAKGLTVNNITTTPWPLLGQVGIHRLGLVTWQAVVSFLRDSARQFGEEEALQDLHQLNALCQRMDRDAFIPFRAEELSSASTVRVFAQLATLPAKVITRAADLGICEAGNASTGEGYIGRIIKIGQYPLWFGFSVHLWQRHLVSPIWLVTNWRQPASVPATEKGHLRSSFSFVSIDPSRFPSDDKWGNLDLPMLVEPGRDGDEVVNHLVQQISNVRNALLHNEPPA